MDVSQADILVGVKQVQKDLLMKDKTYMFFSHVIKGQPENQELLRAVLDRKVRLIDYECLRKDGIRKNARLIAFGGMSV